MIASKKQILSRLSGLEKAEVVRVAYAVESGSRAWNFASVDSDYDVRFLYLRRPEWYFSVNVERRRDVIELPIEDGLDINGWDLRKACQLFRKSNPPSSGSTRRSFTGTDTAWLDGSASCFRSSSRPRRAHITT